MNEETDDSCSMRIQGYSHSGEGVGRVQGKPVFVPLAIRDELIRMRLVQDKKHFLRGELLEVIEPGPGRAESPCRLFPHCGGCQLLHQSYEEQLWFKQQAVASSLQRIGRLKGVSINQVFGMSEPWHYRHTARFHIAIGESGPMIGYFHGRSKSLQPINQCALLPEEFPIILSSIIDLLKQETPDSFPVQEVILRKGWGTEELLICFLTAKMPDRATLSRIADLKDSVPGLVGILYHTPERIGQPEQKIIWGRDYYHEKIAGTIFEVPATAFFQNNPEQAEKLVTVVRTLAKPGEDETMLDLYCGVGLFTLTLASSYQQVLGIEENRQAIEAARKNARLNGINNSRFMAGRVEQVLREAGNRTIQTLILDPPRTGCSPSALKAICSSSPHKIIYVSCNPATLARDLAILTEQGYLVQTVQPVDMFPQTFHVESIIMMTNSGSKGK